MSLNVVWVPVCISGLLLWRIEEKKKLTDPPIYSVLSLFLWNIWLVPGTDDNTGTKSSATGKQTHSQTDMLSRNSLKPENRHTHTHTHKIKNKENLVTDKTQKMSTIKGYNEAKGSLKESDHSKPEPSCWQSWLEREGKQVGQETDSLLPKRRSSATLLNLSPGTTGRCSASLW